MPVNQRKIAEYFLENLGKVALLPIKNIATEIGVSEASVVRFGQILGYKGFKELKDEISNNLQDRLSPTERYQAATLKKQKEPDTLSLVAQNVISNINNTISGIDQTAFSGAVDLIIQAKKIYCFGMEISSFFSRLLTFLLRLYTYDAQYLSIDFLHYLEQVAFMSTGDLIIAFSFSPYSRETVEAVEYATKKSMKSIAFTDKKTAPITKVATHTLHIKTDNIMFSNSLGAVSVIINAIMTELNFRDPERTLHALKIIEDSIRDERYFITQ